MPNASSASISRVTPESLASPSLPSPVDIRTCRCPLGRVHDGQVESDQDRTRAQARAVARQAEGNTFAASLVGLDREEAARRTTDRGFEPEAIPHTVEAVILDLRHNRIRLFLDENGKVARAHAG
jgi:hypothetical protein